jgi:hypothetical protein
MRARRSSLGTVAALLLALTACEGGATIAALDVRILDADGRNPLAAMDGTLTVRVRHEGQLVDCAEGSCMAEVRDGSYELVLPIASFEGRTEIHVEAVGHDAQRWIGASPTFVPFGEGVDAVGGLRLLVDTPARCAPLTLAGVATNDPPRLTPARARVAAVRRRNVVLLAGGEDRAGADDDHVDRFDQLLLDANALTSWDRAIDIGPAHGVALSEDVSLVVGARSVRFVRDSLGPPVGREIALPGASYESAVVSLGASGAAVVAGAESRTVHWVGSDGQSRGTTDLVTPRTSPAAALMAGGVLVVGGQQDGPAAEWVRSLQPGSAVALRGVELPAGARGGVLFASPDGRSALWIGFDLESGPSADTFVFRRCPEDCTVELGPRWERARSGFAATVTDAGALWLAGGRVSGELQNAVERVRWDRDEPQIEEGPSLAEPRADATVLEHAFGTVLVIGGRGDGGLLDGMEICTPEALDEL